MKKHFLLPLFLFFFMGAAQANDSWLPTLKTDTPEQGFELAVKIARMGVKTTQPNVEILKKGRADYADDAEDLIAASQVVAIHFATVAAANDYWN